MRLLAEKNFRFAIKNRRAKWSIADSQALFLMLILMLIRRRSNGSLSHDAEPPVRSERQCFATEFVCFAMAACAMAIAPKSDACSAIGVRVLRNGSLCSAMAAGAF